MSAAAVAPQAEVAMRKLYRHALESIFAFASLKDLHSVTAVCRVWMAAVNTMPPIHATSSMGDTFNCDRLSAIRAVRPLQLADFPALHSRLARHVSSLGASCVLDSMDCLEAVGQRMLWMRELSIRFGEHSAPQPQPLMSALRWFESVTRLELSLGSGAWDARALNSVIAVVGEMSMLQSATLRVRPEVFPLLSFAPLIALQALRTLWLKSTGNDLRSSSCTDLQVAEFRSMRSLQLLYVQSMGDELLVRMLQPGHAMRWTQPPRWMDVTERLAPLLGSLPTLTELQVTMFCSNISFFSQLPQLTSVTIFSSGPSAPVDPNELVRVLAHCSQMQKLDFVGSQLSDQHLAMLLPCFPKLADLSLAHFPAVKSLRCLDTPALAASLTRLSIQALPNCPSPEVVHLLNLRSLRALGVTRLPSPVSADLQAQFVIPSQRFPVLKSVKVTDAPW